jgi:glycogen operon protein
VADTSIEEDDAIREEGNEEVLPSQKRYVVPSSSLIVLIAK